ncbi:hypothetical protein C8J56DRAFT_938499 [Mycena floridula]|nr:hypothetical protein C8J56DRAFT_963950 [Mycena floridula]KAJ7589391.1 hypothetical protein C8J56DRAFT_938499 [Mycena floridula]
MHEKGRMIGRQIDMFLPMRDILDLGMAFDPKMPGGFGSLTRDQQCAVKIFDEICDFAPEVITEIEKYGVATVAAQIDMGRRASRSEDINSIKARISSWRTWLYGGFPSTDRTLAGFRHPELGLLLCPVTKDFSDASVRQGLRDGTIVAKPEELCNLLYPEDAPFDVKDLLSTFLRNGLMLQTALHVFRGPSFALGKPNGSKKGNAGKHNIREVTISAIAYIACILRFVLSSQTSFSSGASNNGDFASESFYNLIKQTFNMMDEDDQEELLQWWNERLYAGLQGTNQDIDKNGTSAASMLAAQIEGRRKEKVAAKALAEALAAAAAKAREAEEAARATDTAATNSAPAAV